MDIIEKIKHIQRQAKDVTATDPVAMLQEELSSALWLYWSKASAILKGSGISLLDPVEDFFP